MLEVVTSKTFSIRTWLLAVVAATIMPLVLFGLWLTTVEYERTREAAIWQLTNVSRALLQAVEREFQHREGTLLALAASPALRSGDLKEFYNMAHAIVARMPPTSGIILADESGQQIINTRRPFGTSLPRRGDMTPVNKVFETRKTWVSDLFTGALMNIPVVGIDIPVLLDGKVAYDLALSVPIEELDQILSQQRLPEGWIAAIVDRSGTIVSRSVDSQKWIGQKVTGLILTAMESSGTQEGFADGESVDGIQVLTAWSRSLDWGWAVSIAQPKYQIEAIFIPKLSVLLASGTLAILLGALLASLVSRRISKATSSLAASAAEMGTCDYKQQISTGIAEIDSVSSKLTEVSRLLGERSRQRDSAEEHQRLLMAELDHRVKNILASVQALARQTLQHSPDKESLTGRIMALAQAHNILATTQWRGGDLTELVQTTLLPHRDDQERVTIVGPKVVLDPRSTQALSLVLHELCVNATKYGSLSRSGGSLSVNWDLDDNHLKLNWIERGGPEPKLPTARGFGSKLIELSISELGGDLKRDFDRAGLWCTITVPVHDSQNRIALSKYVSPQDRPRSVHWTSLVGKKILLVEDSALIGKDLSDLLIQARAQVVGPAVSVQDAIELAKRNAPDAAILDVNLNGELAFPIADALRDRNVPFLFITGYGDPYVWPKHLRDVRRLTKLFDGTDVLNLLAALLRQDRSIEVSSA